MDKEKNDNQEDEALDENIEVDDKPYFNPDNDDSQTFTE